MTESAPVAPLLRVSDTGSYSDLVFGLLELLGISYRPALADLPDQKGWRISASADYGPLNTFVRGKIDVRKVRRNWEDILRVVASIYTGTVRAYDVVAMLQRDGQPTALGEAILARRQRGESIRTIAAGVKVSVGVVHKTLAGAQPDTQRGAGGNRR